MSKTVRTSKQMNQRLVSSKPKSAGTGSTVGLKKKTIKPKTSEIDDDLLNQFIL